MPREPCHPIFIMLIVLIIVPGVIAGNPIVVAMPPKSATAHPVQVVVVQLSTRGDVVAVVVVPKHTGETTTAAAIAINTMMLMTMATVPLLSLLLIVATAPLLIECGAKPRQRVAKPQVGDVHAESCRGGNGNDAVGLTGDKGCVEEGTVAPDRFPGDECRQRHQLLVGRYEREETATAATTVICCSSGRGQ